ncbi:hypothetical protein [Winogradskyella aquimaris]|uniref:Uncharacterized protein n=1 Tax=Winogradskyella aquimaris TaxID=864074 RepID=A0ABU5EPI7_9FLAO|nr:hypothetical protein [Winogradskyella aquimaris]MDY2588193.1 hypothetical protein [Winogradskyella aquimaris]
MKKVYIVVVALILNTVVVSCTPESIVDRVENTACCGEEGEIPPPPPPPPPTGSGD